MKPLINPIDWGMSAGEFNTFLSVALGFVVPWATAWANQKHWSSGWKFMMTIIISLLFGVLQVGTTQPAEGLSIAKAFVLIFMSSQAIYKSNFVKNSTSALEEKTSKNEDGS